MLLTSGGGQGGISRACDMMNHSPYGQQANQKNQEETGVSVSLKGIPPMIHRPDDLLLFEYKAHGLNACVRWWPLGM